MAPEQGRWFTDADAEALGPTLVVNEAFLLARAGRPVVPPDGRAGRRAPVTATVVGVVDNDWPGASRPAFILYDQLHRWIGTDGAGAQPAGRGRARRA